MSNRTIPRETGQAYGATQQATANGSIGNRKCSVSADDIRQSAGGAEGATNRAEASGHGAATNEGIGDGIDIQLLNWAAVDGVVDWASSVAQAESRHHCSADDSF